MKNKIQNNSVKKEIIKMHCLKSITSNAYLYSCFPICFYPQCIHNIHFTTLCVPCESKQSSRNIKKKILCTFKLFSSKVSATGVK